MLERYASARVRLYYHRDHDGAMPRRGSVDSPRCEYRLLHHVRLYVGTGAPRNEGAGAARGARQRRRRAAYHGDVNARRIDEEDFAVARVGSWR